MPYPYETATGEQRRIGSWWWCVHHDLHMEPVTETPEVRAKFIRKYKPSEEVETRLRNFAPVLHPDRIPQRIKDAWIKYVCVWAERDSAWYEYTRVSADCEPELMLLHREEYPDTTWNGRSIFA